MRVGHGYDAHRIIPGEGLVLGGVSIKYAETSVENAAYTSGTSADKDGRTIALSFAF